MGEELKQLIEDAAKLLGFEVEALTSDGIAWVFPKGVRDYEEVPIAKFNPLDPERGDLRKLMEAAELAIDFSAGFVWSPDDDDGLPFTKGDYQSIALAVLRAASAVLKARGGE